jgi:hypothetical protein
MDTEISALRKQCKHLMVEQGLDLRGGQTALARKLGIHRNALTMALSGYRESESAKRHLEALLQSLSRTASDHTSLTAES